MPLRDLETPAVLDTSSADLIADFFIPALSCSVQYDRGVGYFSSGWLRITAKGMVSFAANGGRARWVTSPILDSADWEALQTGDSARTDPVLRAALSRNIHDLERTLETDTLSALAWMVADGILSFKLAVPVSKLAGGDFHDKFGVFTDSAGIQVSFNGSYNESVQGTRNYESIKIFRSWEPAFGSLVQADVQRFERLWQNDDPNVRVFELPEAAREQILQLRESERPYPKPKWLQHLREPGNQYHVARRPALPDNIQLRSYQEEASDAWFGNKCHGILEMATGTGKTITALSAVTQLFESQNRLLLVISCPYKHLVEQWASEAENFGFRPIRIAESRRKWETDVARALQLFKRKQTNLVTLITTNASLQTGILPGMLEEFWSEACLIADEAHHMGAPKMLATLPESAPWRLGLSATPVRHYDEDGTEAILSYFGEVVFSLPLKDVIGTYLTPYYYYPIPVEMTEVEFDTYCQLTEKLKRYQHSKNENASEIAQRIAIKRARVLNNSLAKLDWIQANIQEHAKISYTLFYSGEQLFGEVTKLLGIEKKLRIHEFTQRQSNKERQEILERFSSGNLQALVAMKCLDEGVDVPPTRTAYFLASSGNPREFVQRRGRVLRKAKGKEYAVLHDLISIPPRQFLESADWNTRYSAVRAAVRREYRRIKEFAELATNKYQALDELFTLAAQLEILDA